MPEFITISPARFFGPITALVTFRENHTDRQTITSHPVEQGAEISDHAFDEPAEVQIDFGATNSGAEAGGDDGYVINLYQQILALKSKRVPFQIQTGKRLYDNMLLAEITVTTDERSEAALMFTAHCRQIIIVPTQVVTVPPAANQADPKATSAVTASGTKQAQPSTAAVPSWQTPPDRSAISASV